MGLDISDTKLAEDFTEQRDVKDSHDLPPEYREYYERVYDDFAKAFKGAADDGFVQFH